jgi:hypothetical protein
MIISGTGVGDAVGVAGIVSMMSGVLTLASADSVGIAVLSVPQPPKPISTTPQRTTAKQRLMEK